MAIGAPLSANGSAPTPVYPASVKGDWITVNDDLEQPAETTGLLNPAAITASHVHWCRVGANSTRALIRARYAVGATVTDSPIVKVLGSYSEPNADGSLPTGADVICLNSPTDADAAGLTLTLVSSGTGLMKDSTYAYSDIPAAIDLLGVRCFTIVAATAANVTSGTVPGQACLIN